MSEKLALSQLGHTWLIDLDGTVLKHNGYKIDGFDSLLSGAKSFLDNIPAEDKIIFLTSRPREMEKSTREFLAANQIKYDLLVCDLPCGERILINDKKPGGLLTAIAINPERDAAPDLQVYIDSDK